MNTPRTDALLVKLGAPESKTQIAQHARQLETECAELRAALENILSASASSKNMDFAKAIVKARAALAKVPK